MTKKLQGRLAITTGPLKIGNEDNAGLMSAVLMIRRGETRAGSGWANESWDAASAVLDCRGTYQACIAVGNVCSSQTEALPFRHGHSSNRRVA